ncbi:MAG: rRNA methyltransferase [Bacteroidetes bacterium 4484_276]|nr:MAG: rRNA methyltransferase [Bacteroidetes bacterium 4484_276]OYT13624.1 MAG: rRNA methyltransferase [Bacteroidetes bacterium 4572_114]
MDIETKKLLYEYLAGFITENKRTKFEEIISNRTRYLTVVLEDIYQPHNASAVLRTCDCFGVQDVHIIENQNHYEVNPDIALGSSKWLTMIKHNGKENNTPDALATLRKKGYRIVATTPHENDVDIQGLSLDKGPVALVFGTEMRGLTGNALTLADEFVKIPMYGFTESFNISVSAGISLFYLTEKLRNSAIDWQIPEDEKIEIKLNWARQVIKRSDLIENDFLKSTLFTKKQ